LNFLPSSFRIAKITGKKWEFVTKPFITYFIDAIDVNSPNLPPEIDIKNFSIEDIG